MHKRGSPNTNYNGIVGGSNLWWDCADFVKEVTDANAPGNAFNAQQFCLVGGNGMKYKIRYDHIVAFRGIRQGQAYDPTPGITQAPIVQAHCPLEDVGQECIDNVCIVHEKCQRRIDDLYCDT